MTARVGAVHLGWDVVSVAAGGGGSPIRPVLVEGTYTPPAYLLADSSGRLHTAGVDRRPDVGIAISDVRDIIGHPQIVVAGATWPAELVFRARMHNPFAAVVDHLGGEPDVLALPYPDEWPDPKVDEFVRLVEQLGVPAEPLPESVALSGYVRALGLVRAPGRGPGVGAVGVYSDGRECLVVAVHGNDEQPTESVSVAITAEALHEARAADNVVIEVMAAARAINADTSTVLLTGNVCFNDALRLAFQNHLGHRFQVADHPMHALVLGATHLLVADSEGDPAYDRPAAPPPAEARPVDQGPRHVGGQDPVQPLQRQPEPLAQQPELVPRHLDSPPAPESGAQRPGSTPAADTSGQTRRMSAEEAAAAGGAGSQAAAESPAQGRPAPADTSGQTRRITAEEAAAGASAAAGPQAEAALSGGAQSAASAVEQTHRITAEEAAAFNAAQAARAAGTGGQAVVEGQGSTPGAHTGPGGMTQRMTAEEVARLAAAAGISGTAQAGVFAHGRHEASATDQSAGGVAGQEVSPEAAGTPAQSRGAAAQGAGRGPLPAGLEGVGGRFMRPPGSPADDQATAIVGRDVPGGAASGAPAAGYGPGSAGAQQGAAGPGAYGSANYGQPGANVSEAGQTPGSAGVQQGSNAGQYGPGGYGQAGGQSGGGYGQAAGQGAQAGGGQSGGGYGQAGQPGYGQSGGHAAGGYGQGGGYGKGGSYSAPGQSGPGTGGSGYPTGQGYAPASPQGPESGAQGYGPANAGGSEMGPQGGAGQYGPGGGQPGAGGQYGQAGGYGAAGGYGQQGGYSQGGYPSGGYGAEGDTSGSGRPGFAGSGGNAPGQPGAMYGGAMSTGARQQHPQSSEDAAGQSDSESGSDAERKQRKGKLWNKMRKPFGAPIIVGAATLSLMGMHSGGETRTSAVSVPDTVIQAGSPVQPVGESCAVTPFVFGGPHAGIATVGDPKSLDCLRFGIDTLRYTVPGPARGIDPGPPLHI
ncbi:hypothetical protein [Nocardia terrae]|uniref:hypothetical protein n=1 Tax=Nocardia terrae TaxID=2675851 RepID=UPI001F215526|nr:hypothetical protein [Nocardia terrae]